MAEQLSVQMAKLAASPLAKLQTNEMGGVVRVMFATVTAVSAAIADTIYFGMLPKGVRITGASVTFGTGAASSTMNLVLRKTSDKSAISGTIMAATSITTATTAPVGGTTGTLTVAGASYVTTDNVDVVGTIAGAATPASQVITVRVEYVLD